MRVLVTGVTGTVGSAVAERFARAGASVRGLVRGGSWSGGEAAPGDVTDARAVEAAVEGVDVVVHGAVTVSDDVDEAMRVNAGGTRNVVEAVAKQRVPRLVHVSTVSVYDYRAGATFREDGPIWTENLGAYGWSKAEAERVVQGARGVESVILRPVVVLSMHPRSYWGPLALERARRSKGSIVPLATIPYVHVDNLADAVWLAASRPAAAGFAYNVCDGDAPAQEYLDVAYRRIGKPVPEVPEGAPSLRYPAERLRQELGWAPTDRWKEFLAQLAASS